MLAGVVRGDVQRHQGEVRSLEEGAGARGEVGQASPDGEDEIGVGGQRVGGGRAAHADRADAGRVVPRQRALAGLGLRDGNAVALGEGAQRRLGQGVVDPPAGDEKRPLGPPEPLRHRGELGGIGPGALEPVDARLEEVLGVVERLRLHVLGQGERHGAAGGRVREDGEGGGEALEQLLGARDPVPVPRDGPEAVVGGDRRDRRSPRPAGGPGPGCGWRRRRRGGAGRGGG